MASQTEPDTGRNQLLNGWKQISAYFAKDERTTRRWAATKNLPVHRVSGAKGATVFAYSAELDAWLRRHQELVAGPAAAPEEKMDAARLPRPGWRRPAAFLAVALLALAGLAAIFTWRLDVEPGQRTALYQPSQQVRELYLRGVYLSQKRTRESLAQAADAFGKAAELAPDYAAAHAGLATTYDLMVEYLAIDPEDGYRRAEDAARRAVALDPRMAEAQSVLADIEFFWRLKTAEGLARFEQAVKLDPGDAQARHWRAAALVFSGRAREALVEIDQAQALEPQSRSILVSKGYILLAAGHVEAADTLLGELIRNEPQYRSPYRFLSFVQLARGDHPAYLAALERRFELTRDEAGRAVAAAGRQGLEQAGADGMKTAMAAQTRREAAMEPYFLAHVHALAGDWEKAAAVLEQMKTRHRFYYAIDPAFAAARHNAEFRRRIAAAGLPVVE